MMIRSLIGPYKILYTGSATTKAWQITPLLPGLMAYTQFAPGLER
jgi:hypothetical protein